jgi:hypothetical protein
MVTLIFWPQSRDSIEFVEEWEESSCGECYSLTRVLPERSPRFNENVSVVININDIDEDISDERNGVRH